MGIIATLYSFVSSTVIEHLCEAGCEHAVGDETDTAILKEAHSLGRNVNIKQIRRQTVIHAREERNRELTEGITWGAGFFFFFK